MHPIDTANISNDFVFTKVMENEQLCKNTLEEILNIKISKIKKLETQKFVNSKIRTKKGKKDKEDIKARGVRFDVYLEGDNTIYNLEMQTIDTYNLPQRARYYLGNINSLILKPKDNFNKLAEAYVIFICTFDLLDYGKSIYRYIYKEMDLDCPLNDGSMIIFLNTTSEQDDISENLKGFLKFIECSTIEVLKEYDSPLALLANDQLKKIRADKKVRSDYMNYSAYKDKYIEEGMIKGIKEGEHKKARETAKNLLHRCPDEEIAEIVGLPIEEVKEIRRETEVYHKNIEMEKRE